MQVRVLLFASLRELAGASEMRLDVASGSTAAQILLELKRRFPQRQALLDRSVVAINEAYAEGGQVLHEQDTVAVIPPVSGGADVDWNHGSPSLME